MKTLHKTMDREMQNKHLLQNEDGSIIIIVLIVLMLVTMMGVSSTTTSSIEIQIAGNERTYKQNFYTAEAATMEALQTMDESSPDQLKLDNDPTTHTWMQDAEVDLDSSAVDTDTVASTSGDGSRYYAINRGFTTGTSLGMTGTSQLYTFEVHGFVDRGTGGRSHIEVGYKRRF